MSDVDYIKETLLTDILDDALKLCVNKEKLGPEEDGDCFDETVKRIRDECVAEVTFKIIDDDFVVAINIFDTESNEILINNFMHERSKFTKFLKKSGCFEVPLLSIYERIGNKITETENKLSKINSKLDGSIIEMEDGKRYKLVLMED